MLKKDQFNQQLKFELARDIGKSYLFVLLRIYPEQKIQFLVHNKFGEEIYDKFTDAINSFNNPCKNITNVKL